MVGWHHQLNKHEFEQTLGDSRGQGSLVCYKPQGHRELDTTELRKQQQQAVALVTAVSGRYEQQSGSNFETRGPAQKCGFPSFRVRAGP